MEGVLYEEELLDGVVRKLYDLIGDTATFVIGYAKRGPASTRYFSAVLLANLTLVRSLRSTISLKDHNKIEALLSSFSKLKEDFDRAVDVAVLTVVRRTGKHRHFFSVICMTDTCTGYDRGINPPQPVETGRSSKLPGETRLYGRNPYDSAQ